MWSNIDSKSMSRQATNQIVLWLTCLWAIFLRNTTFCHEDQYFYAQSAISHKEYTVFDVKSDTLFFTVDEFSFMSTDYFTKVKYLWKKNVANS